MEFSRQEYWSGLPFPSLGDPDPGIKPGSPTLQADAVPSESPVQCKHDIKYKHASCMSALTKGQKQIIGEGAGFLIYLW